MRLAGPVVKAPGLADGDEAGRWIGLEQGERLGHEGHGIEMPIVFAVEDIGRRHALVEIVDSRMVPHARLVVQDRGGGGELPCDIARLLVAHIIGDEDGVEELTIMREQGSEGVFKQVGSATRRKA